MAKTFADKVRNICQRLGRGGREFTISDVAVELDLVFKKDKRPLYLTLKDFRKTGEVERVGEGIYLYKGRNSQPVEIQRRMWRILRVRKKVTVADLQELADASAEYAREWLRNLMRNGVVKRKQLPDNTCIYRLVKDPVEMPRNVKKADKLRLIRKKKKEALAIADRLYATAVEIRIAINSIPEEDT